MPETLAYILHPIDPFAFRSDHYTKSCLHIPGKPDKFSRLFSWASLNTVLNSAPAPNNSLHFVLNGRYLSPTNELSIVEQCRRGATLIVIDIQKYDHALGEFTSRLSTELGETARINLYLSQPGRPGYNRHYDTHDVFILQISGSKGWRIFSSPVAFPIWVQKTHPTNAPETPCLECVLRAGDVLYIPRGYWHEAMAEADSSLHLTLGIYVRTGVDFASWLVDELREEPIWRQAAPLVFREESAAADDITPDTRAYFDRLRHMLSAKLDDEYLATAYRRFCIAQDRNPSRFHFPYHFAAAPEVFADTQFTRADYQRAAVSHAVASGEVELAVWGKQFHFSGPVEPLLRFVFQAVRFTGREALKAAGAALPWVDVAAILGRLLQEGVVNVVPGSHSTDDGRAQLILATSQSPKSSRSTQTSPTASYLGSRASSRQRRASTSRSGK